MKALPCILAALVMSLLCSTSQSQTLAPLKPGDPVNIELKVPAEDAPNVTSKYNVSGNGTVKLPYLDREISAAGLTTTQLARRVEEAYRAAQIYTNPTINCTTIAPTEMAPHIITVGGEVRSGGREVPVRDGMRLYQAIMAAGGFTEFADVRRVRLMRGNRSQVFDMRKIQDNGSNNPVLQDGDTVHVPQD